MSERNNYDYLDIRDEIENKIELLEDFAEYEGTEVGESTHTICQMWRYTPDYISHQMYKALVDEIDSRYKVVKEDYELVEEKETVERVWKRYEYKK